MVKKMKKKTIIKINRDIPKIVIGRKKKVVKKKKKSNRKFQNLAQSDIVLPWKTDDEWNDACRMYQGSDYASILRQILLWKLRVPSLPVGAEMTLCLVQALDFDSKGKEGLLEQELMMRTLYSLALVRFMNHISHFASREVGGMDLSMTDLAAQMNVPSWLVDLRHEATHGAVVPSIAILRIAGDFMQKWLAENYWNEVNSPEQLEMDDAEGGELEQILYNRASDIISAFVATRIYHVREIKKIRDIEITKFWDSDKLSVRTKDAMIALKRAINIGVAMDPDLLCCALAREMTPLPEIYKEFGNAFPERTFRKLKIVWNPILKLLKRKNKLGNLCQELANIHVSTEEAQYVEHFRYLSARWLKIILRRIRKTGEKSKYSKKLSSTVLPIIMKAPNPRTQLFINELLDITTSEIGTRAASKSKILTDIWNDMIYVDPLASNRSNRNYTFKSVEDIFPDHSSVFLALNPTANGTDKNSAATRKNIPPDRIYW